MIQLVIPNTKIAVYSLFNAMMAVFVFLRQQFISIVGNDVGTRLFRPKGGVVPGLAPKMK
jgi:hypothetical protein